MSHFKLAALLITQRTLRLRLCGKLDIFSSKFETSPKKIAFDNRDCLHRHFCWNYSYSYYKGILCSNLFGLVYSFDCGINISVIIQQVLRNYSLWIINQYPSSVPRFLHSNKKPEVLEHDQWLQMTGVSLMHHDR